MVVVVCLVFDIRNHEMRFEEEEEKKSSTHKFLVQFLRQFEKKIIQNNQLVIATMKFFESSNVI